MTEPSPGPVFRNDPLSGYPAEDFLTADLRTEFHRSARPGTVRAEGWVVQRNRRVVFCAAELFQNGELIASASCTQIVRRP